MLVDGIIYPVDKYERAIPMVVQHKNHDLKKLRIYVDFKGLNKLTIIDPLPTLFAK
jgi:hypothetical protein